MKEILMQNAKAPNPKNKLRSLQTALKNFLRCQNEILLSLTSVAKQLEPKKEIDKAVQS